MGFNIEVEAKINLYGICGSADQRVKYTSTLLDYFDENKCLNFFLAPQGALGGVMF